MPGATIESHDGDDYTGRLDVKLGPMDMTYHGNIHFVERDDAAKTALVDASAKEIRGHGSAKTQVSLRGASIDQRSEITLSSEFSVSGKAARLGRNVMEEVGEALMKIFATRLAAKMNDDATTVPQDIILTNSLNRSSGQHTPAKQAIEAPNRDGIFMADNKTPRNSNGDRCSGRCVLSSLPMISSSCTGRASNS